MQGSVYLRVDSASGFMDLSGAVMFAKVNARKCRLSIQIL